MRFRKAAIAGLTAGMAVLAPSSALAQTTTTPPPPGGAEAVAAEVDNVVKAAHTDTSADQNSGTATANALEVGGSPALGNTGGTQTGEGSTSGALIAPIEVPGVVRVDVAPFEARVERANGTRRATGNAAVLRLVVVNPGLLAINILQSFSEASHTDQASSGRASSDGATITLAGLRFVLLHSEASTAAGGESYLVGINDTKLVTNRDIGQTTKVLEIPGLLRLNAVTVNGGPGSELVSASAVDALVGAATGGLNATLSGVSAAGSGQGTAGGPPAELDQGDNLPRTGAAITGLLVFGLALIFIGAVVAAATRRRAVTI